jgi:hypothetical protein
MIRNISDLVFFIGAITLVFLTTSTANFLGIEQVATVSTTIIFLFALFYLLQNVKILIEKKKNKSIIYYSVVILLISGMIFASEDIVSSINFLKDWLTPVIILLYFENIKSNKRNILIKVLIIFFLVECFLGIYERFTSTLVFGSLKISGLNEYSENLNIEFRAQSLLGHPLNNAHMICIMLSCILISFINNKYKLILLIIGVCGILSFNSRVATIAIFIVAFFYFLMARKNLTNKQYHYFTIIFIGIFTYILYLMFTTDLGGRLIYGDRLMNGSANVRLKAFDIFTNFYNRNNLLFGLGKIDPFKLTENGYLNLMITLGIPAALLLISTQAWIIFSRLHNMNIYGKIIILTCFFVVGFSNNALASSTPFLMFCIWLSTFNKKRIKKGQNKIYTISNYQMQTDKSV